MFKVKEEYRIKNGIMASDSSYGNNGAFSIKHPKIADYWFYAIASDGEGWEHVSVSLVSTNRKVERCPTWEEMCFVKKEFWSDTDCVVQYHPPKSEYVNNHQYCLHLWRPIDRELSMPPSILVGTK